MPVFPTGELTFLGVQNIAGDGSVKSLTVPAGAVLAWVQAEGENWRVTFDASNPSAGSGFAIAEKMAEHYDIPAKALADFRAISDFGGGTLHIVYWGMA